MAKAKFTVPFILCGIAWFVLGVIQDVKPKFSDTLDLKYPDIPGFYRYAGDVSDLIDPSMALLTQQGKLVSVHLPVDETGKDNVNTGIVAVVVPKNTEGRYYTYREFMNIVSETKDKFSKINADIAQNQSGVANANNMQMDNIDMGKEEYAYATLWHIAENNETFLESVSQVYIQGKIIAVIVLNDFSSQKDTDWNISTTKTFIEKLHGINQSSNILEKFITMNRIAQQILVSMVILGVWCAAKILLSRRRACAATEKNWRVFTDR